jgi:adenylate cyclase
MSFMGDGFLAVYPCERHHEPSEIACRAALAAAFKASARMAALNDDRRRQGMEAIGFGIGLHVGNVMFGNVGLNDRLTFSAFGTAVNEASRLQALTKKYAHTLIASKDFADYCGGSWITIGKEKLRGVKQKLTVLYPDTKDIAESEDDAAFEISYDGVSDAEQLMLLLREDGRALLNPDEGPGAR